MPATLQRQFSVHGIEDVPLPGRLVEGVSFEDAVLHYVEDRHLAASDEEVSLLVEDCDTGEQQCFRIDLATGEAAPCP